MEQIFFLVVVFFIIVTLVIVVVLYNAYVQVIQNRNSLDEALSGIDVQLKKRYDLIPNILTIAKKFMEHEKSLLTEITELRTETQKAISGTPQKFEAEALLGQKMSSLMVSMENYPQLKSDATMVQAMQTYNEVEEHVAAARRFYNAALRELKNSVMIFPGSLFASYASDIGRFSYFETDTASKEAPVASAYL
jgi:LemA protein